VEAVAGPLVSKVASVTDTVGHILFGDVPPEDMLQELTQGLIRELPNIGGSRDALLELTE
jgi:hypothetical protein